MEEASEVFGAHADSVRMPATPLRNSAPKFRAADPLRKRYSNGHSSPFFHKLILNISKKMKVILLGSTGFIGKAVLDQCLKNPAITSIIALSRRDLPNEVANPKLTVVIVEDLKLYQDSVLGQLKDADACIW